MVRLFTAQSLRTAIVVLGVAAVLLPLAVIWVPELRHYYVATPKFDAAAANEVLASINPATCTEFARHDLMNLSNTDQNAIDRAISALERNAVDLPDSPEIRFTPGFAPSDLVPNTSRGQLAIASLVVPDLMLRAWERTGSIEWLRAARDYIVGWWSFESRSVFPQGLQWNDHAVAARVFVLTRYLCAAKHLSEFRDPEAVRVLEMIFASGERLTKPSYYTYRTNHGIMQNLALLHIAASFPAAAQSKNFAEIGVTRLGEQLKFYVGPEGSILEHSAGYQAFGVELLGMVIRYFQALSKPLPDETAERYTKSVEFFAQLRRPDGTLPSWGNTSRADRAPRVLVGRDARANPRLEPLEIWPNPSPTTWAPVSAVAIWWDGGSQADRPSAQTLVTWANFATQAHKHADEMSILVWTERSDVLVASGYWPYDAPHRHEAVGWAGSNAPRYVGEDSNRRGQARLLGFASSPSLELVDMERTAASGAKLRRQVIYLRPSRWIVLDTTSATSATSAGEFEVTWIFDSQLRAELTADNKHLLLRDARGPVARADFAGCEQGGTHLLEGSIEPFGGWTAWYGGVRPAPALLRRCSAMNHASFVLRAAESASDPDEELVTSIESPDQWEIRASTATRTLVSRRGELLDLSPALCGDNCQPLRVMDGSHYEKEQDSINSAYKRMSRTYARFNESWLDFRVKSSKAVLAAWVAQLGLMILSVTLLRRWVRHPAATLACLAIVFWISFAVWLETVYFT